MTQTAEPRAVQGDEQQAVGALRLKADTSLSGDDHWDQRDPSGGESFANVQFDDIIFADES